MSDLGGETMILPSKCITMRMRVHCKVQCVDDIFGNQVLLCAIVEDTSRGETMGKMCMCDKQTISSFAGEWSVFINCVFTGYLNGNILVFHIRRPYNQSFLLQFQTFGLIMSLFLTILTKLRRRKRR